MATNFEFYKTKLLYSISENDFCIKRDGAIGICSETPCNECVLYECAKNGPCNGEAALKWANAEHIEAPKLTKRERAFCEAVPAGWIARDEDGKLYLFDLVSEPYKQNRGWLKRSVSCNHIRLDGAEFRFINWEDEKPWAVEDLLKLEVIEEVQEDG